MHNLSEELGFLLEPADMPWIVRKQGLLDRNGSPERW